MVAHMGEARPEEKGKNNGVQLKKGQCVVIMITHWCHGLYHPYVKGMSNVGISRAITDIPFSNAFGSNLVPMKIVIKLGQNELVQEVY